MKSTNKSLSCATHMTAGAIGRCVFFTNAPHKIWQNDKWVSNY